MTMRLRFLRSSRVAGNKAGDALQKLFYDRFLKTHYEGRSNIPPHTNFIVAANHTSHLDMGLTKMALAEAGKDMVVLAAADYFFDTKYKRAVIENFTNLVPMERTGSLRQSLRHARSFLDRGYNALIFPEGTRSVTGEMADFKPVIGYLALHAASEFCRSISRARTKRCPKVRTSSRTGTSERGLVVIWKWTNWKR